MPPLPIQIADRHVWCRLASRAGFDGHQLARNFGVTERHLRRRCEALFGQPLHVWLLERRLNAATRFLVETGSVKQAAVRANYRRVPTFIEHFLHYHQITPAYYLKQVRQGRWPAAEG